VGSLEPQGQCGKSVGANLMRIDSGWRRLTRIECGMEFRDHLAQRLLQLRGDRYTRLEFGLEINQNLSQVLRGRRHRVTADQGSRLRRAARWIHIPIEPMIPAGTTIRNRVVP